MNKAIYGIIRTLSSSEVEKFSQNSFKHAEEYFCALINLVEIKDVMHADRHMSVKKEVGEEERKKYFPSTCFPLLNRSY